MAPADPGHWRLSPARSLALDRPRVMGVLNVTPDSFSDGGRFASPEQAVQAGLELLRAGADLLDIGGESTRPGAASIPESEQVARVVPVIQGLRRAGVDTPITIDTTRAAVACAALDAGADAVNDVSAGLDDPDLLPLLASRGAGLVLMHRLVPPDQDSYSTAYARDPVYDTHPGGVVGVVRAFLAERLRAAVRAGLDISGVAVDPGLGFGKTVEQNFELVARVQDWAPDHAIVLAGASRKSFIGQAMNEPEPTRRIEGSVAAAVALTLGGAHIIRAHDVREHVRALAVAGRIRSAGLTWGGPAASRL